MPLPQGGEAMSDASWVHGQEQTWPVGSAGRTQALKRRVALQAQRQHRRDAIVIQTGRLLIVAGSIVSWQLLSGRVLDPFFVSSPTKIYRAFMELLLEENLLEHAQYTTIAAVSGFFIGSAAAIVSGFLLTSSGRLYGMVEPIMVALYGIPKSALAPLFIMWFGIGITSKIIIAAIFVYFVVLMNTVSGIRGASPQLIDLVRLMGARNGDVLLKVVLPTAMPFILTALRIVVPLAMIGTIVGELISAQKGLGFLISRSTFEFSTHAAFAGIFTLMVVVVLMNAAIGYIERPLMRWRPQQDVRGGEGG